MVAALRLLRYDYRTHARPHQARPSHSGIRRGGDPASSYTARLLAGGPRRAAEKVVEEAGEVATAALAGTDEELRNEAADLVYHALVLLASRGISLEEVERTLALRHASPTGDPPA